LIDADSLVELTKVVERLTPLKRTTVPATNPVPLTVKTKPMSPALAVVGEIVVIVGLMVRLMEFETPPPGAGLNTVIGKFPALTMSVARIVAVNCVALTYVVVFAIPLNRTTEPAT